MTYTDREVLSAQYKAADGTVYDVPLQAGSVGTPGFSWWDGTQELEIEFPLVMRTADAPEVTPVWYKPLIGVTGGTESAFQTIDAQIGYGTCRRTYNQPSPTVLPASFADSDGATDVTDGRGRVSYWSWKPSVTGFPTSSTQQAAFSAFLDSIPSGHETVIVAWHEPEDNIEGGDFTLAQWGALQDSVAAIVRGKGRPELRMGICLMGQWTFDTRSGRTSWDWAGCLDWDLIDVVGIDPYRTTSGSTVSLEQILTVNNSGSGTGGTAPSTMAALAAWGKPISLMEWAVSNSTEESVATYITDAYAWFKRWNQANPATPIESAIWFNYSVATPPNDNFLTGVEVPAYAAIVADSKVPPS